MEGASTLLWVNNTDADLFRMGISGDFYFLVAGRWFKAAEPRRPVDLRDAVAARRLQEDPGRASAIARAGLRARHAAGDRGGAPCQHSANGARQQEGAEGA